MNLPNPAALGLPEKFTGWRPEQIEAIMTAIDADQRFVTLCMPTGSGKSLTYYALHKLLNLRTCILTSTKALQDQLGSDFSESGLADLRGRSNYECLALAPNGEFYSPELAGTKFSVESGPCHAGMKCSMREEGGCTYYDAVGHAAASMSLVTNYAKWLTDIDHEVRKFDMLVLDEAHAAPDELAGALGVEIEHWEVESLLRLKWPKALASVGGWISWAKEILPTCDNLVARAQEDLKSRSGFRKEKLSEVRHLKALQKKLVSVARARGQWVSDALVKIDRTGNRRDAGVRFDPVWPAPYAEEKLFRGVEKVVLVSATIRPKTLDILGIKSKDSLFIEYPSSFPVVRRPIIWVPTTRVSHKSTPEALGKMYARIDEINTKREDRSGIIHSVSYARRNEIVKHCATRDRMLTHTSTNTREVVRQFKQSQKPTVLVSPSVDTGFDFPYTEAEFCIIVKVPFPDTRSVVLKARVASDKEYGNYLAAQTLVQMAGRGMRAADDRFETFIIDDNVQWFMWHNKHLFPKWFHVAFRKNTTIPPAPQKLG